MVRRTAEFACEAHMDDARAVVEHLPLRASSGATPRSTALQRHRCLRLLKGSLPTGLRVVEPDLGCLKTLGVEGTSEPCHRALELLMQGIEDDGEQIRVAVRAATILRRTCPSPADASGVLATLDPRYDCLEKDVVLPTVAEVVLVLRGGPWLYEELMQGVFPTSQDRFRVIKGVLVRDTDLHLHAGRLIVKPEGVKVIVLPAHRVLNRDVQVPKTVGGGDLNVPPDRRLDIAERDPELEDLTSTHGPIPQSTTTVACHGATFLI
jgi:hypothetical protein